MERSRMGLVVVLLTALSLIASSPGVRAAHTGDFTAAGTSPEAVGTTPVSVAVGRFNADAFDDLAVSNEGSSNITILLGDGTGNFTEAATSPEAPVSVVGSLTGITVGRFDANATDDLAVTTSGNQLRILLGDGTGNFTEAATSPEASGGSANAPVVGRFNADAIDDLAVAAPGGQNVAIHLGTGTGDFAVATFEDTGVGNTNPYALVVGRFNGDAFDDLAVANYATDNVGVLLGDGTGNFTAAATSPEAVGDGPFSISTGSFNADAFADLAVMNIESENVSILLGDGTGDFSAAGTSPEAVGTIPQSVAVGRFNADTFDDLAVPNGGDANVSILLGDGTGDFSAAGTSPEAVGTTPIALALGGFNADSLDDLAVANRGSANVTVLLGGSPAASIANASVREGRRDLRPLVFTITLDAAMPTSGSLDYTTVEGSAKDDKDFVPVSGTINFVQGDISATISVDVKGDRRFERDERFKVVLSNPVGLTIDDAEAKGMIRNDDRR